MGPRHHHRAAGRPHPGRRGAGRGQLSAAPLPPTVSTVVCTYTARRWDELVAAVHAVDRQLGAGDQVVVVVDHDDALLARARAELPAQVVPNRHARGLSGARNTGTDAATGDVVAFLDDDALPPAGWLDTFRRRFADPRVVAVGGAVEPRWEGGRQPAWFPLEFGWVVGCDYVGLPPDGAVLRNPIGASMAVRRDALRELGGFSELVGRVGTLPVGCEETELGIRLGTARPDEVVVRDTGAPVAHLVPRDRQTVRYFRRRCYHEGRSKRVLSGLVGTGQGLSSERRYVTRVLPLAVARHLAAAARGDLAGLARAALVLLGLAATAAGYLSARPAAR